MTNETLTHSERLIAATTAEREQFRIALLGCLAAARIGLRDIDEFQFDSDKIADAKSTLRYIENEANTALYGGKESDSND